MKIVFNNSSEVLHIYATQSQKEARTRNVFFEDKIAYSYGYRFPMSKILDDKNILITTRTYSNTTAKHLSELRYATNHYNQIFVYNVEASSNKEHKNNLTSLFSELNETIKKSLRAKKYNYSNELKSQVENIRQYCKIFDVKLPKEENRILNEFNKPAFLEQVKEQIKKESELRHLEQVKIKEAKKEAINKWLNFESDYFPNAIEEIKLRVKDDIIQTSKGATVPLKESKFYYDILKNYLATKNQELYERIIGKHLGSFTINRITDNQVIIGCHRIDFNELERIFN